MSTSRTWMTILAAAVAASTPAIAQEAQAPISLTAHPLKRNIYWVEGGSANTGFIVGDKGVVVIDAQMTVIAAEKVIAEVKKVTEKSIDAIIITHADPDHVGGLPGYPAGSLIVAQENARSSMAVAGINGARWGARLLPLYHSLLPFLPSRTVGGTESTVLDGVHMVLIHTAPAHTSGDLAIYLPEQKLVFAGDIVTTNNFTTGRYPIIHPGGSSLGWIASMKALLALDADIYVPGHGMILKKLLLQNRLQDAEDRRDQVKKMIDEKKTLAEVEAALPDSIFGGRWPTFTKTVFIELTEGYPPAAVPSSIHEP